MKVLAIILMTFFSVSATAMKLDESLIIQLKAKRLNLSSAVILHEMLKNRKPSQQLANFSETILKSTSTEFFTLRGFNFIKKFNTPSFHFLTGVELYKNKQFKKALKLFKKIPIGHRYYAESILFKGSSQLELNKVDEAANSFFSCRTIADDQISDQDNKKIVNYFKIIKDRCTINLARIKYEQGKYQDAITNYNKVSKKSFLWPYTLIEKAWSHFNIENYNRALGLLSTYKAPLLSSYFFPESEVLTALSYNKLCLWDDSEIVIKNYYEKYKKQSEVLKGLLSSKKNSKSYFINLYEDKNHELNKYSFIKNIKAQVSKKIHFNLLLLAKSKISKERDLIKDNDFIEEKGLSEKLNSEFDTLEAQINRKLNHIILAYLYEYINKIHKLSMELFNINLEIVAEKRDLLYQKTELVSDRARGSIENVKRESHQFFFTFDGPFWADELGDYSFGLKSNCSRKNS